MANTAPRGAKESWLTEFNATASMATERRKQSKLRPLLGELPRPTRIVYNETKAYPFRADENDESKSDGKKATSILRVTRTIASKPTQSLSKVPDVLATTDSGNVALYTEQRRHRRLPQQNGNDIEKSVWF